jgi:hypothetical protein
VVSVVVLGDVGPGVAVIVEGWTEGVDVLVGVGVVPTPLAQLASTSTEVRIVASKTALKLLKTASFIGADPTPLRGSSARCGY